MNKKEAQQARRIQFQAKGLCYCGRLAVFQHKTCALCLERQRRWRNNNKEHFNNKKTEIRRRDKDLVFTAYGGYRCACCGEAEKKFLQIDHINGGGHQHRLALGGKNCGGPKMYCWLRLNKFPPGYQVLCANCNWGKAQNGGICPHDSKTGLL